MSALSKILRSIEGGLVAFWCPGCDEAHAVRIRGTGLPRPSWEWNNDVDRPTFTPSILVRGVQMTAKGQADYDEWCRQGYPARDLRGFDSRPHVCHSFVTDGQIRFLDDCTHALAGKTVQIPEFPA